MDLYKRTIEPVKEDLLSLIKEKGPQEGWKEWVEKWSKLSVDDFLRTNINSDLCSAYRPWPEAAIRGLQVIGNVFFKLHESKQNVTIQHVYVFFKPRTFLGSFLVNE